MDWETLVQNEEVEASLRDAATRRLVEAPIRARLAVSSLFQRRPQILTEVGSTYATLVLHDRESGRILNQAKQRYRSITPGLFAVDLDPTPPTVSDGPIHFKGRGVTISSESYNTLAVLTHESVTHDLNPQFIIHPNSSILLRNVAIGKRSTISLAYRMPLALIIVFGDELTRGDAGFEADAIFSSLIDRELERFVETPRGIYL